MWTLTNRHHFFTTYIWDALNANVNRTKTFSINLEQCSNREFLPEQLKNHQGGTHAKTVAWSCDMEGHAQKCMERNCELANKKTEQLHKVASPCLDDHHFRKEELESVGELSKVCSQIVFTCWYLAQIGRPDILWSLNKLARSVTKWTGTCDRRLAHFISYTHHTSDYRQYCHVGNTAQHCRLSFFQDFDFGSDLEDSKSTSEGIL